MSRVSSLVAAAKLQIRRARTLQEVARAMDVDVRAQFRCLKHLMTDLRQLPAVAEARAEQILRAQLAELDALPDEATRRERMAMYRATQWRVLYGRFPRLARLAETASISDRQRAVARQQYFPNRLDVSA